MSENKIIRATKFRNMLREHTKISTNDFYLFVQLDNPEIRETRRQGFTKVIFLGEPNVYSIIIYDGNNPLLYNICLNNISVDYHNSGLRWLFLLDIPNGLDAAGIFFPGDEPGNSFINNE